MQLNAWLQFHTDRHLRSTMTAIVVLFSLSFPIFESWATDGDASGIVRAADPDAGINGPLPNFSGVWTRAWTEQQLFDPPDRGPGPVTTDPEWPHVRGRNDPWIADLTNPILLPHTRARLRELAEEQWAGGALLDNDSRCLPVGVLGAINLIDPMQILQTPTQVIFLYARDHIFRIVDLNRGHIEPDFPTWYGDSVAHYEANTLVVDTIGMNDKTLTDRYGTPHTDHLHTVERYNLSNANEILEARVTVEDPLTFAMAWSARFDYERNPTDAVEEIVCAENNRDPRMQLPTDPEPDF